MTTRLFSGLLFLWGAAAQERPLPKGFEHFYNLEFDAAIREFRAAAAGSDDPRDFNHVAQAILYREMFRVGALESELVSGNNSFLRRPKVAPSAANQKEFNEAVERAMTLSRARLQVNVDDVPGLYALGVAHGLRANYNFLVRKAWRDALRDATEARKLHDRVLELDPAAVDARLVQGVHDYVVGSLPVLYKMVGFLVGFRGDREAGIRALQAVAERGNLNRYDAQVLLAAIYRRDRRPAEAIPLLERLIGRFPRNYLLRLELAQMHADAGRKDAALALLLAVEQRKLAGGEEMAGLPLAKVHYYIGNLLFWYDDLDAALDHLRLATERGDDLDLNSGVLAWMRLGQAHDLRRQRTQAVAAYRHAIAFAPEAEAARESRGYLSTPYRGKR